MRGLDLWIGIFYCSYGSLFDRKKHYETVTILGNTVIFDNENFNENIKISTFHRRHCSKFVGFIRFSCVLGSREIRDYGNYNYSTCLLFSRTTSYCSSSISFCLGRGRRQRRRKGRKVGWRRWRPQRWRQELYWWWRKYQKLVLLLFAFLQFYFNPFQFLL